MNRASLSFCLLVFSLTGLSQQFHLDKSRALILDSAYQSYVTANQIPGLAVGIMLNDTILFAKGFGVKNLTTKEPVTSMSLFHVASLSKPFVATAIMQMVEKGRISLDSPLVKYLPYFKLKSDGYKAITIRQMLNHTSGIPDVQDYEWDNPQFDDGATERYVRSLKTKKLAFEPGDDLGYSNMAYDILGDVISKTSGKTFEDYMIDNILSPSGMTTSTFLKAEIQSNLVTTPHTKNKDGKVVKSAIYPYNRCHAASSTLHSSIAGLLNWAKMLTNDHPVLKFESFCEMTKPNVEVDPLTSAGLGWFIHDDKEVKYVFHIGRDLGFTSMFTFFPKEKLTIAVLSNCDFLDMIRASSIAFRVVQGKAPLKATDDILFVR
jgi:CubicO group peptidase (beta-lactamase class C family)